MLSGHLPKGLEPKRVAAGAPSATGLLAQQAWRLQNSEAVAPPGSCVKDAGNSRAAWHSAQGRSGVTAHPPHPSGARSGPPCAPPSSSEAASSSAVANSLTWMPVPFVCVYKSC